MTTRSLTALPEVVLACAIIERAVLDWRQVTPTSPLYYYLIEFFHGKWCAFLWESAMGSPVELMLNELKIPERALL